MLLQLRKIRPFRVWYYLRQGYGMYLVFVVAVANMMVTTYYLAIQNIPLLKQVFPGFVTWIAFIISIGVPLAISLGYWHVKRSNAQRSQMEVETEINPYYYRLPPGFWKEVFTPLYSELLKMNLKLLQNQKLTEDEIKNIKELQNKLELLMQGHSLDHNEPRKFKDLDKMDE
jgi:hypothetical protein